MDSNNNNNSLVQELEKEEKEKEDVIGVPVCGGNLTSPVVDTVNYIGEVHYKIGTRLYIENAD
jgi:acetaldehyde dehydrogenase (acetylating)